MTRIDTLELFDGVAEGLNADPGLLTAFGDLDIICVLHAGRETERVRLAVTAGRCTATPVSASDDDGASVLVDGHVTWWSDLLAGADPAGLLASVLPMLSTRTAGKTG